MNDCTIVPVGFWVGGRRLRSVLELFLDLSVWDTLDEITSRRRAQCEQSLDLFTRVILCPLKITECQYHGGLIRRRLSVQASTDDWTSKRKQVKTVCNNVTISSIATRKRLFPQFNFLIYWKTKLTAPKGKWTHQARERHWPRQKETIVSLPKFAHSFNNVLSSSKTSSQLVIIKISTWLLNND